MKPMKRRVWQTAASAGLAVSLALGLTACPPTTPSKPRPSLVQTPSPTPRPSTKTIELRLIKKDKPVLELVLHDKSPIPARALDPVLVVGDRQVTDYRYKDAQTLVFTEPDPDALVDGSEIVFQWGVDPTPERERLEQVYEKSTLEVISP